MKLYEKMGIDLNTVEGIEKLLRLSCLYDMPCRHERSCPLNTKQNFSFPSCASQHLLAEVPTIERFKTYDGDFVKAKEDFLNQNGLFTTDSALIYVDDVAQFSVSRFVQWLMEEIEVTINEEY